MSPAITRPRRLSLLGSSVILGLLPWPQLPTAWLRAPSACCKRPPAHATREFKADPDPLQVASRQPVETAIQQAPPGPGRSFPDSRRALTFGDRLRIRFTETASVPAGAAGSAPTMAVFPRGDLSGEATVDEDGNVAVPRLGTFAAYGRGTVEVQDDMADAFGKAFGRPGDVAIAIEARNPVYVLGDVRAPGSFAFIPGMTVLQALAGAGGPATTATLAPPDRSSQIENVRETERLRGKRELMARLLIRQARLSAERRDEPNITLPPAITAGIASGAPATAMTSMIASATATLAANRAQAGTERELAERQVDISRRDVAAHARKAEQLHDLLAKKQARLGDLKLLASRGSVPQYNVLSMEIDVSDTALRIDDEAVSSAQAERRQAEAESARDRLAFDHAARLEAEWTATMQDIDDCGQAIATMETVVLITGEDIKPQASARESATVITRKTDRGIAEVDADASTGLMPGDVVKMGTPVRPAPAQADQRSARSSM